MKFIILALVTFSNFSFSHILVEDNLIYNKNTYQYYSHDELIVFLDQDINFVGDKDFIKYKKSVDRLNFKSMKYLYGFSAMSIAAGIDNYNNPEEDDDPDSYKNNFSMSVVLPISYYAFNRIRRDNSLYRITQKYNNLYSEEKSLNSKPPYNWSGGISYGLFSEKIPIGLFNGSLFLNKGEHTQFYATFHSMIFGGGIGLGYKYYFKPKIESSSFISICAHSSVIGDGYQETSGLSFAIGYSKFLKEKQYEQRQFNWKSFKYYTELVSEKIFINTGISFSYMSDFNNGDEEEKYSLQVIPFINSEIRF